MKKGFLAKIYSYIFLYDLIFAYAVYNLLFAENGLSESEISLLLGWWAFVAVVFEIPSGVLADKINRKWLIVAAPILKATTFLVWGVFIGSFFLYAVGFLLWGLGSTLITGTYQAYIYDSLANSKQESDYEKVIGRVNFFKKFGVSLGLIIGGFLASFSIQLAMLVSVVPLILGFVIALSFNEVRAIRGSEENKYFDYMKSAFGLIKKSSSLRFLFITIIVLGVFGNLDEYDQLYYKLVDLPVALFGIIAFTPFFGAAVVESLSYRVKNNSVLFLVLPVASAVLLLIVGVFPTLLTLIALVSGYVIIAPLNVLVDGKIQREIVDGNRATVISFSNFLKHIFGIGLYLIFGIVIKMSSLEGVYVFSGLTLLVYSLIAINYRKLI
ncbi:MFS transporter [Candidatus Dojkabacteria bacterium]|nr:MFS transporter [Candidatus Dojkabacteria bacterium]